MHKTTFRLDIWLKHLQSRSLLTSCLRTKLKHLFPLAYVFQDYFLLIWIRWSRGRKHSAPQHWDTPVSQWGGSCSPAWRPWDWRSLPGEGMDTAQLPPAQSSPAAWGEGRGRWEERSQTLIYVWGFFLACSAVLKPLVAYWIASVAPRPRCFVSSEHSSLVQSRVACCDLHSACSNTPWRETLVIFHLILSMCMHTHAYKLKYKISILSFKLMILFSLETCVGTAQ